MKRIVSFVPSWTETLIEAGANVVGRTRFCVHPSDAVSSIEVVGGTKSLDLEKLRALKPDVIVMDREENTLAMAEQAASVAPVIATHVTSFADLGRELRSLSTACELRSLLDFAARAESVESAFAARAHAAKPEIRPRAETLQPALATREDTTDVASAFASEPALHNVPGVLQVVRGAVGLQTPFVYVIWKDPWMSVNASTFIASMLARAGFDLSHMVTADMAEKYPTLAELPLDALVLLSSEPYPFARKLPDLPHANIAIVDGESFSWFGIRAIRFLEGLAKP